MSAHERDCSPQPAQVEPGATFHPREAELAASVLCGIADVDDPIAGVRELPSPAGQACRPVKAEDAARGPSSDLPGEVGELEVEVEVDHLHHPRQPGDLEEREDLGYPHRLDHRRLRHFVARERLRRQRGDDINPQPRRQVPHSHVMPGHDDASLLLVDVAGQEVEHDIHHEHRSDQPVSGVEEGNRVRKQTQPQRVGDEREGSDEEHPEVPQHPRHRVGMQRHRRVHHCRPARDFLLLRILLVVKSLSIVEVQRRDSVGALSVGTRSGRRGRQPAFLGQDRLETRQGRILHAFRQVPDDRGRYGTGPLQPRSLDIRFRCLWWARGFWSRSNDGDAAEKRTSPPIKRGLRLQPPQFSRRPGTRMLSQGDRSPLGRAQGV
mmetsp:Transcript_25389/g.83984  ORF Transcript_25389/g.83984 Transcript_25389/m.83984 type:complete len:379 (+) Transcript_25389:1066-2202(+)